LSGRITGTEKAIALLKQYRNEDPTKEVSQFAIISFAHLNRLRLDFYEHPSFGFTGAMY